MTEPERVVLWRWKGDPAAPGGPNRRVGPPGDWSQDDRITSSPEFQNDPEIEIHAFVPEAQESRDGLRETLARELEKRAEYSQSSTEHDAFCEAANIVRARAALAESRRGDFKKAAGLSEGAGGEQSPSGLDPTGPLAESRPYDLRKKGME